MSILKSNGILTVSSIPTHEPSGTEATLARLVNSNIFYYWNSAGNAWNTLVINNVSDLAYDATAWNGVTNISPSLNSVRDIIESIVAGALPDGDYGSVTVSGSGTVITIDAAAVTLAMMANIATDSLIGRDTAGSGVPQSISVGGGIEFTGLGGIQTSALTGDVTKSAGGTVTTIANDSITLAKMADMNPNKVLGRGNSGIGNPVELDFTVQAQQLADDSSFSDMRTTLGLAIGTDVQAYDPTLASLAIYNTNGLLTQTAVNTFTGRTATGTANEITVTNGDGVLGNPTFSLPTGINPTKLADGSVSATEFQYLNGVTSAIQTQLDSKAADADVVHDTGNETIAGVKTFTSDPLIPDEVYGSGWDGTLEPPTKNAVYDKIEALAALLPVDIYEAVITQAGTSAPSDGTPMINTLGEDPSFIYNGVGDYELGTVGTPFTVGKTTVLATLSENSTASEVKASWSANNKIVILTFNSAGAAANLVGDLTLSITVRP